MAMEHDPFKPPQAPLEVPREQGPPPARVKQASTLIWVAAILGLAQNAAIWTGLVAFPGQPQGGMLPGIVSGLATFAFFGLLGWKIRVGRNWARWIFAVLVVLGLFGWVVSVGFAAALLKAMHWSFWVTSSVQTAIQVTALVFLFTAQAREYFRN